jgi:hypothetical protein
MLKDLATAQIGNPTSVGRVADDVAPPPPAVEITPTDSPELFLQEVGRAARPEHGEPPAAEVITAPPPPGPFESAEIAADLDSDGLPWDERIHASSKTRLKKTDQWKPKRGISPDLKARVEGELRAVMSAGVEEIAPPPPVEEIVPPTAPTTEVKDFTDLVIAVTNAGISPQEQNAACQKFGLEEVRLVAMRPDLAPAIARELGV